MVGWSTNGRLVNHRYCASKWAVHGFCASLRTELLEAYGEKAPKVRTPGHRDGHIWDDRGLKWGTFHNGSSKMVEVKAETCWT